MVITKTRFVAVLSVCVLIGMVVRSTYQSSVYVDSCLLQNGKKVLRGIKFVAADAASGQVALGQYGKVTLSSCSSLSTEDRWHVEADDWFLDIRVNGEHELAYATPGKLGVIARNRTLVIEQTGVRSLCFVGSNLAFGKRNGEVGFCDTSSGAYTISAGVRHARSVGAIASSKNGSIAASGSADGHVKIWKVVTEHVLQDIEVSATVTRMVFLDQDKYLIIGLANGEVAIWDCEKWRQLRAFSAHRGKVLDIAVIGDSCMFATSGVDREVAIWDAESGQKVWSMTSSSAAVTSMAFLPHKKCAVLCHGDEELWYWEFNCSRKQEK